MLALALAMAAAAPSHSQATAKRCDLVLSRTPGDPAGTACLDLVKLQAVGNPIQTDSAVTRIAAGGISICKSAFQVASTGDADIVFLYDNSYSMGARWAYVDKAASPPDTQFYFPPSTCSGLVGSPFVLQTMTGAQTAIEVLSPCMAYELSGDPYNARGFAIQRAVDYIRQISPTSTAGAAAFTSAAEGGVQNLQAPLQLGSAANAQTVKSSVALSPIGSFTDFRPAFKQAYTWFKTPGLMKTQRKAIIFISDGVANDDYLGLVDSNSSIPIHSIYFGWPKSENPGLQDLSARTGGTYNQVDPRRINEKMDSVVRRIMSNILISVAPDSIVVTNNSQVPPQTGRATGPRLAINPDGSVNVTLDDIVALRLGINNLSVRIVSGGKANLYSVSVKADGPLASDSANVLKCFDQPSLLMLNAQGQQDPGYPNRAAAYSVRLLRQGADVLTDATVRAVSVDAARPQPWGDLESILLPLIGPSGASAVFQRDNYSLIGNGNAPINGNQSLEASPNPGSKVVLTWNHPRDAREFARYELPALPLPVATVTVRFPQKPAVDTLAGLAVHAQTAVYVNGQREARSAAFTLAPSAIGLRLFADAALSTPLPANVATTAAGTLDFWMTGSALAPDDAVYRLGLAIQGVTQDSYDSLRFRIPRLEFTDASGTALAPLPNVRESQLKDGYPVNVRVTDGRGNTCTVSACPDPLALLPASPGLVFRAVPAGPDLVSIPPAGGIARFLASAASPPAFLDFSVQGTSPGTRSHWRTRVEGEPNHLVIRPIAPDAIGLSAPTAGLPGGWSVYMPVLPPGGTLMADSRPLPVVLDKTILASKPGGIVIEANKPFTAVVHVYGNLGNFVSKLNLTLPENAFNLLEPGETEGARRLWLIWSGQADNGEKAATGAYIFRVLVTLQTANAVGRQRKELATLGFLR